VWANFWLLKESISEYIDFENKNKRQYKFKIYLCCLKQRSYNSKLPKNMKITITNKIFKLKESIIYTLIFFTLAVSLSAIFVSCESNVNESIKNNSDDSSTTNISLEQFIYQIDSASMVDGGGFIYLKNNLNTLYTFPKEDVCRIYFSSIESMEKYALNNDSIIMSNYFQFNDDEYETFSLDTIYEKNMNDRGFSLSMFESIFLGAEVIKNDIYEIFKGKGDEAFNSYLEFSRENGELISCFDDACFDTPLAIAKRVSFYDNHIEKYDNFLYKEYILSIYKHNLYALFNLVGIRIVIDENFDFDMFSCQFNKEFEESLNYLSKNSTNFTKDIIAQYISELNQKNWKPTNSCECLEEDRLKYFEGLIEKRD